LLSFEVSSYASSKETRSVPDVVPVATLKNVTRLFGANRALDSVDLAIPPGAVGLLGPNGAGKSTMLKILLGLLAPTSGTATVLGLDPTVQPIEVRRRIGYMPEVDSYITGLTAVQAVTLAGVLCGLPRTAAMQRAHGILQYVGLGEARYRKVEEYSTGMRQRVRLAQALIHDPELLFLDEPTNGLDPEGRTEILAVIRDLASVHGKHVVLCTHLLRDVEETCENVVVLFRGTVRRQASMDSIRGDNSTRFRVRLRGNPEAFTALLTSWGAVLEPDEGGFFVLLPEGADSGLIVRAAVECAADLRSIEPDTLSLEDAFVAAISEPNQGAGA
jgi:ABC-2 type transport system ATP-binding protein